MNEVMSSVFRTYPKSLKNKTIEDSNGFNKCNGNETILLEGVKGSLCHWGEIKGEFGVKGYVSTSQRFHIPPRSF